jgi:hypothetical protein
MEEEKEAVKETVEEVVQPQDSRFWPRVLLTIGLALGLTILCLILIKFGPGLIKAFGLLGSIVSVWIGWTEIQKINKKRKER